MKTISWIIGAGGIGTALADRCHQRGETVTLISRRVFTEDKPYDQVQLDYSDELAIESFVEKSTLPDALFVVSGLLHDEEHGPEKTITQLETPWLQQNIEANVYPSLKWMKVITKQLKPTSAMKVICFSARVGSISDNKLGGWHSYRMSKAMLNMLVKNIALEWEYVSPTSSIVAYHPGTVETGLSKPFSKHIKHTIFNPTEAARHCLTVRDALTTERSGLLIDWQDKVVDY